MNFITRLTSLNVATLADRAAKHEAAQFALSATMPLTAIRLGQLCVLGEKMVLAARALAAAERAVFSYVDVQQLDYVLPDC